MRCNTELVCCEVGSFAFFFGGAFVVEKWHFGVNELGVVSDVSGGYE